MRGGCSRSLSMYSGMKVSDMPRKPLRTGVMLDSRYPVERDAIALLKAVPASGERTTFLRSLVLIGYSDLCKDREQSRERAHDTHRPEGGEHE